MQAEKRADDAAASTRPPAPPLGKRRRKLPSAAPATSSRTVLGLQQSAATSRSGSSYRSAASSAPRATLRSARPTWPPTSPTAVRAPRALASRARRPGPGRARGSSARCSSSIGPGEPFPANVGRHGAAVRYRVRRCSRPHGDEGGAGQRGPRGRRVHLRAGHLLRPGPRTRRRRAHGPRALARRPAAAATRLARDEAHPAELHRHVPGRRGAFEIDMQTREGGVERPRRPTAASTGTSASSRTRRTELEHDRDDPDRETHERRRRGRRSRQHAAGSGAARRPRRSRRADRGRCGGGRRGRLLHGRPPAAQRRAPGTPQGSGLSPRFNFQPSPAGIAGVGQTQQPPRSTAAAPAGLSVRRLATLEREVGLRDPAAARADDGRAALGERRRLGPARAGAPAEPPVAGRADRGSLARANRPRRQRAARRPRVQSPSSTRRRYRSARSSTCSRARRPASDRQRRRRARPPPARRAARRPVRLPGDVIQQLPPDAGRITVLQSDELETAQNLTQILKESPTGSGSPRSSRGPLRSGSSAAAGARRSGRSGSADRRRRALLVIRKVAGGYLVENLTESDSVRPAVNAFWTILSDGLAQAAWVVVVIGMVGTLGAWITGEGAAQSRCGAASGRRSPTPASPGLSSRPYCSS